MSNYAIGCVWKDQTITNKSELLLLIALADLANDEGAAWPGTDHLAMKCRCDPRTVQRVIISLKKSGKVVIDYNKGPYGANMYWIKVPGIGGVTNCRGDKTDLEMSPNPLLPINGTEVLSLKGGTGGNLLPFMSPPAKSNDAEKIYAAYPRKVAKPKALQAIAAALKKIRFEQLLSKTIQYAKARALEDPQFTPYPASWFRAERYNDDPSTWVLPKIKDGEPPPFETEDQELARIARESRM